VLSLQEIHARADEGSDPIIATASTTRSGSDPSVA
jgi:hypothetical protein